MKKGSIKGMDGKELEAYFPAKSEPLDLNNLNELDVNENSAGGGAHEEAMVKAFEELGGSVKKKCCGGDCHSKKEEKFPTTLSWDAPKEIIKDFVKKAKEAHQEEQLGQGTVGFVAPYDYPLDKAFDFGYNVDTDPINKLLKMAANFPAQNKVKIDDTIESDLLKTEDLRLGRLYRVAGMNLVARFAGKRSSGQQNPPSQQKTLLQIKHHGTILYVEEKQLTKATPREVQEYLHQF